MKLLNRNGYGSNFNNIYIYDDNIKKESKNEYGYSKIKKEINFYKNIPQDIINVPTIIEYGDNYYIMKYLSNYIPLYLIFNKLDNSNKLNILDRIYKQLNNFHKHTQIIVDKAEYNECYKIETYDKIFAKESEQQKAAQKKQKQDELAAFYREKDALSAAIEIMQIREINKKRLLAFK